MDLGFLRTVAARVTEPAARRPARSFTAAGAGMLVIGLAALARADQPPHAPMLADQAASLPFFVDASTPAGTWYLRTTTPGQEAVGRLELSLRAEGASFGGTIADEGSAPDSVDNLSWDGDAEGRWLAFRRVTAAGSFQWFRATLVRGVFAGRFTQASTSPSPPAVADFSGHVTGWSPTYLDTGSLPRAWDVNIDGQGRAVLRIDNDENGVPHGRLKIYESGVFLAEGLEDDLESVTWDGTNVSFVRTGPNFAPQTYTGVVSGRTIEGAFSSDRGQRSWVGYRTDVLGFGLGSRLPLRSIWQAATRARVMALTEGMRLVGSKAPRVSVRRGGILEAPFAAAFTSPPTQYWPQRDDDPDAMPPNYGVEALTFEVEPGSRFDPDHPPVPYAFDGYLAVPTTPPPPGGYRAVVVVNGHGGSARSTLTPNSEYWYGDSFARRGYVVLALDIGHRAHWGLSDPIHPAIVGASFANKDTAGTSPQDVDSDWEEDGERAFAVRRAIDYLTTSIPNIRTDRVFMAGLSMGGEVTTITTALDPRIRLATVAGYSPDMRVAFNHHNHRCFLWYNADINEYVDVSDYEALVAPRRLIVETGDHDATFSSLASPYASDKQVLRRARAAYGPDAAQLTHFLHLDILGETDAGHDFHDGDVDPAFPRNVHGVTVPTLIDASAPGDPSWQADAGASAVAATLFDLIDAAEPL